MYLYVVPNFIFWMHMVSTFSEIFCCRFLWICTGTYNIAPCTLCSAGTYCTGTGLVTQHNCRNHRITLKQFRCGLIGTKNNLLAKARFFRIRWRNCWCYLFLQGDRIKWFFCIRGDLFIVLWTFLPSLMLWDLFASKKSNRPHELERFCIPMASYFLHILS